ncbi:MAG: 3-methyl-2-oxobutanoate hydroxymethyltransferase [Candidatus Tritonobacter lacicola]|nr:3-methyl-2-oxobutanoate hydroxymethyltransferase [Candidatus Tritonobacter lacicola]
MKKEGRKIVALTAYDYATAQIANEAGVHVLLVGDSLGMVVLGYENTLPVTMEEIIHHTKAVARGNDSALLVSDMPFMSFQINDQETVRNAGRLVKEAHAEAVKLEGGKEVSSRVKAIIDAGIPVLGHIGLTPQDVLLMGGYKVQGRKAPEAERLVEDALAMEGAGAFAIVLECIPAELAQAITDKLSIPTIGIGAGPRCDGQILVTHDMLGLFSRFTPKFVKRYADIGATMREAIGRYKEDVEKGTFPSDEYSY